MAFIAVETMLLCYYGDIKTGKTDFALTAPKPLVHFDLDLGFDRVAHRYPTAKRLGPNDKLVNNVNYGGITVKRYSPPMVLPNQRVQGMEAMWAELIADISYAYSDPKIASVTIDTATVMWAWATFAQLERAQNRDQNRIALQQIEYSRPNQEMRRILEASRLLGKNLILVHHLTDIYEKKATVRGIEEVKTGERWAGFAHTGGIADVVARSYKEPKKGIQGLSAVIEACGFSLSAEGQRVEVPTWSKLLGVINYHRWLEAESAGGSTASS